MQCQYHTAVQFLFCSNPCLATLKQAACLHAVTRVAAVSRNPAALIIAAKAYCCCFPAAVPWWAWTGGALGSYYVIIVIIFAQKLGAGTLVATFVCAQLVTSIVLDLTGLVGFSRREFSWQRWLGVALMIAGVVLVTQFPGQTVKAVQAQAHHDSEAALDISNSSKHSRHLTMELQPCSITSASATSADAIVRVV